MADSDRRRRHEIKRRRVSEGQRAMRSQAEQQAAAERTRGRTLAAATRRRWAYWSLFSLAAVIVMQHLLAHSGWKPIPLTMGWQDLLVGYPMGGLLAIAGLFVWGSAPPSR